MTDDDRDDGDQDGDSPGWEAIDAALRSVYGDQEPLHVGTILKYMLGGPDPIDGTSAYAVDQPTPHWHFVTYGFSELYVKESDDPETSGWGFELTFRLARVEGEEEPPGWAFNLLQNLARYVFNSGNPFGAGHKMNLRGPIALGAETLIQAIAFVPDPHLPPQETVHGRLEFLQIVGLTLEEHDAATRWDADRFLELLAERIPLAVTDLSRPCLMQDTAFREIVDAGTERDGSTQELIAVGHVDWAVNGETLNLSLGASGVPSFLDMLRGRTRHQRGFLVVGRGRYLTVEAGAAVSWSTEDDSVTLTLDTDHVHHALAVVEPVRGRHEFATWTLEIVPSEIKDPDGNVVETIG